MIIALLCGHTHFLAWPLEICLLRPCSTKVRTTVTCCECFKPRCVYSRYVLISASTSASASAQLEEISCLECETWYTCGSPLSQPSFVVREGITCSSSVEFAYYSCKCLKNMCALAIIAVNATLKEQYQTVLPLCWDWIEWQKKSPEVNIKMGLFINVDKQNASLLQLNLVPRKGFRHPD